MFGLFGSRRSFWESVPPVFRQHVESMLAPAVFSDLDRLLARHNVQSLYDPASPGHASDNESRSKALSLILVEAHFKFVSRGADELMSREAQMLISSSLHLNNSEWNPAWTWYFYYEAKSLDAEQLKAHGQLALRAYDQWDGWYRRLLGEAPKYDLAPPNVRVLPLYFYIEQLLLTRLEADELELLVVVLQHEYDGVPVKRTLMNLLAQEEQKSDDAALYGIRIIGHLVHLMAQSVLTRLQFKFACALEKCAAAISPRHLPARIDLALMLNDFEEADPGQGHLRDAQTYAQQTIELIDDEQFDLGPPNPIGIADERRRQYLSDMRIKMHAIIGSSPG